MPHAKKAPGKAKPPRPTKPRSAAAPAEAKIAPKTSPATKQRVSKKAVRPTRKMAAKQEVKRLFGLSRVYAMLAATVLLITTVIWSLLGARLQQGNADQIVNTYLFSDWHTFQSASFPGAHTFLIKWPIFVIINWLIPTDATFGLLTGMIALTTISALMYVLYRIDRRPLVFGTLCLALASVLLAVPPQPYAGGILPVNMAMITTRNLEYIAYIASLVLLIRAPRIKSYAFWGSVGILGLLVASDKLFLSFVAGGGLLGVLAYAAVKRWRMVKLCALWLLTGGIAYAVAIAINWGINAAHLTHIATGLSATPYHTTHAAKDIALGIIFGGLGIVTNFGANPAFDAAVLRAIPSLAMNRLLGFGGLAFLVNGAIFMAGIFVSLKMLLGSLFYRKGHEPRLDTPVQLALLLLWSSVAAFGAFVVTNHYFFVDSRYLGITLFAVSIASAAYLRSVTLTRRTALILAAACMAAIVSGLIGASYTYKDDRHALADIDGRNISVARALQNHPVDVLVGDYWRVLPIKDVAKQEVTVMPLDACGQPRQVLSSRSWQPDLARHSFAYLLSFDKSLTNYDNCSLDEVIKQYGRPNASMTLSGSVEKPQEILLYYDHGAHRSAPQTSYAPVSTVLPITPDQLPPSPCDGVPTVMTVVAHQDDDLLFASPDLLHDIDAGHCVRTVYVTAGDGGSGQFYWQARERGSEAAYSFMIGAPNIWVQRTVKLADNEFVTIANPRGDQKIALIFMHLPDGNINGQGFRDTNYESLENLEAGRSTYAHTVDNQSAYNAAGLTRALSTLMSIYNPTEVRTQATHSASNIYPDHSDHQAVGRYTRAAYEQYAHPDVPLTYYYGYPVHGMAPNIAPDDLRRKTAAFMAYSLFDGAVCHSREQCENHSNYGPYLKRQYSYPGQ